MKPLPTYVRCVICGRDNHRGLKVRFVAEDALIRSTVTFAEDLCGFKGVAHGGIITAVLDEAMGWAAAYNSRRICVAAELTVRFVKPVAAGTRAGVVARMDRDRRRVIEASSELLGPDGDVLVRAFGKFMPLEPAHAREVDAYLDYEGCERGLFVY